MAGKFTAEEKAERVRQRAIEHAKQFQLGTYTRKFVATVFQQMIRAEEAAHELRLSPAIVDGEMATVFSEVGFCVCVTCGKVEPWKSGLGGMHTGHFLASRRNSILFDEYNVAPQCSYCNYQRSGEQQLFRKWMLAVRGPEVVERLERLKNEVKVFSREELVDMKIAYAARLKAAEEKMKGV